MRKDKFWLPLLALYLLSISTSFSNDNSNQNKKMDKLSEEINGYVKALNVRTKTSGNKLIETMDSDNDGVIDLKTEYIDGKKFKQYVDSNGDGKFNKVDWYFQNSEIFHTSTVDSNHDGKVDLKIVRTSKGAKDFHFFKKVYRDKDFDGTFDTKRITEVSGHEYMQVMANANEQGQTHSVNCSPRDFAQMNLPAILDRRNTLHLQTMMAVASYDMSLFEIPVAGQSDPIFQFDIRVQKSCLHESNPEDRGFFTQSNILDSLKQGLGCLGRLSVEQQIDTSKRNISGNDVRRNLSITFKKAVSGLIGYRYDGNGYGVSRMEPSPVHLLCKHPSVNESFWVNSSSNRQAFAMATYNHNSNSNRFRDVAPPPNIMFRMPLTKSFKDYQNLEYPGQRYNDRFKKLLFHEYLHTSLGTVHHDDEEDALSPDMADACGDYCFNPIQTNAPQAVRDVRRFAKEICGGGFDFTVPGDRARYLSIYRKYKKAKRDVQNLTLEE